VSVLDRMQPFDPRRQRRIVARRSELLQLRCVQRDRHSHPVQARQGRPRSCNGRLDQSRYEKDGEKRTSVSILVNQIEAEGLFRPSQARSTTSRGRPSRPSRRVGSTASPPSLGQPLPGWPGPSFVKVRRHEGDNHEICHPVSLASGRRPSRSTPRTHRSPRRFYACTRRSKTRSRSCRPTPSDS